jgi:hypothetical protein
MTIQVGDATRPAGDPPRHRSRLQRRGWLGAGFVVALSKRWTEPEAAFRRWLCERAGNDFALGAVQVVQVKSTLWVANLIGQHGVKRAGGKPPVRYESIRAGLALVRVGKTTRVASVCRPPSGRPCPPRHPARRPTPASPPAASPPPTVGGPRLPPWCRPPAGSAPHRTRPRLGQSRGEGSASKPPQGPKGATRRAEGITTGGEARSLPGLS